MKKIIYLFAMCAGLLLVSCEKDEIGGTATESLAGEWYVTVDAVDTNGNVVLSDENLFGLGNIYVATYNTAANIPTEMYVDDLGYFWEYKVKVKCDADALTFATDGSAANEYYDCDVTIDGGKILPGAATTPHGTPADSIVFYVSFSDDAYPAAYGYAKYRVAGYRYTGLVEDD